MKTAIMGAGSLGTIIGAFLAKSGLDVLLIDINKENTDALNKNGARIIGHAELQAPVRACTPGQMEGQYDLVLLLTKQWNNPTALPPLNAHLKAESIVCTLQNGIPEESVGSFVGAERVVGGTVGFGAIWREPGISELATTMEYVRKFAFDIGEISNKITPKLEKVASVLNNVGHTEILENFTGARWSKLLMNTTFSGMSAALGCSFGEVLHNPEAMPHLMRIADETVRAAHASGVTMINMQSFDFNQFALTGQDDAERLLPVYRRIWANHTATRASMLQDIEKGRPCEIDYINGHVCATGRARGIATPVNDHVVKLVKQAEKAGKAPDFTTNLATFKNI
jgi:2-dehydropantoate 2-reductase